MRNSERAETRNRGVTSSYEP